MTAPAMPGPQAQPGQRMANGYVQMGGGYDTAVQQHNRGGQQPMQQTQPMQPTFQSTQAPGFQAQPQFQPQQNPANVTPLGVPAVQAPIQTAPPMQQQGWFPAPQPQPAPQQFQPQPMAQPLYGTPAPVSFSPPPPAVQPNGGAWPYATQQQPSQQPDLSQIRLTGTNIPPHLQNRSVGEIIQIAEGLRNIHLGNIAQPQQGIPPLAVPPRQPVQPPQQQNGQAPAQGQFDWRNPGESMKQIATEAMTEVVQQHLAPALQPVVQNAMIGSARQARDAAAAHVGPQVFAQLEPMILQKLQGIDPRSLTNPETWRVAADLALGEVTRQRGMQMPAQQPQQPGGYPVQHLNAVQNPLPNLNSFFTEAPNYGGAPTMQAQLSQAELGWAAAMGMTPQDYSFWKGGAR